jgi:FlaA1/EpsC-like NDP-sugar epimerase
MLLVLYAIELSATLWLAYELRFDFVVDEASQRERLIVLMWFVPMQLGVLAMFQQLNPLLGYFSTPDLARMFHALLVSAILASGVWYIAGAGFAPPRGVIMGNFIFALVALAGVRLALRALWETGPMTGSGKDRQVKRVAIIGAGDTGATLAHDLALKPAHGLEPVAFFEDDERLWHSRLHGVRVLGAPEKIVQERESLHIDEAIIAMPSAPAHRVGEILKLLRDVGIPCRTVPSIHQLALGQVSVSQLRNVEIQDLLGRDRVVLETESIRGILQEKVVMVTGAGGSIGSELCRQIASYRPTKLLMVERSEPSLFQIEQELIAAGHGHRIVPIIGDVLDGDRMQQVFAEHQPNVVFHAAAHKHVPMMESQPGEAMKNNALGTARLADLSLKFGVSRFTLISTDKAINPTSVMGATKRLAEMYIHALAAHRPNGTKFMAVRFGNVLGSSGSVIPIFKKQIADGGPVKVTHPDMTRYFMTIPEAVMLVLQSAMQGSGGDILVLDMGKPVRIMDLARQMIELSGLKPDEDIRIEVTGVRPGEKLFEEITHVGENFVSTTHPKIFRFVSKAENLEEMQKIFDEVKSMLHEMRPDEVKGLLGKLVPGYVPAVRRP